jgi:hypothetical protein
MQVFYENTFLNQILGFFEKRKRRNGLFLFVDKQEWQQSKKCNIIKRKMSRSKIPTITLQLQPR